MHKLQPMLKNKSRNIRYFFSIIVDIEYYKYVDQTLKQNQIGILILI